MYLPHRYINLFLGNLLMLQQAYELAMVAVAAEGAEVPCTPLLDWLRAACTRSLVNGVATDALLLARAPLEAPVADENLLHHQYEFVVRDMPALDPNTLQHGVQHIAATIGN